MKRSSRIVICIILVITLTFILSCSAIPQGVKEIFTSSTPTNTNTPTATATATATPLPPISIVPCAQEEDCPGVAIIYDYLDGTLQDDVENEVRIPYDEPLLIYDFWRAKDESLLDENLENMEWYFTIDGRNYFREDWFEKGIYEDFLDPTKVYPAYYWGVIMDDWELGKTHVIRMGYTLTDDTYDGWLTHEKGYKYETSWLVRPVVPPTATPTATATYTPTPKPTAIPYTSTPRPTATPACQANASLEINNTTGGYVTLKLSGPASYTFDLKTGTTMLQICSGSYSYQAWGCGGARDSGTMQSNSAHEFYCQ